MWDFVAWFETSNCQDGPKNKSTELCVLAKHFVHVQTKLRDYFLIYFDTSAACVNLFISVSHDMRVNYFVQ